MMPPTIPSESATGTRRAVDGFRVGSEHGVLACPCCGGYTWVAEIDQMLHCEFCRDGLSAQNNIVDCLQMGDAVGSGANDWDTLYREGTKSYSAEGDWWRLSSWRTHLFRDHLRGIAGKLVVDFGCGTAVRVAALAPIQLHGYRYVGIDSSLEALKRAAQAIPGGLFVHGALDSLRLQPETADFVLCLGVLMYSENLAASLDRLLIVLKRGGVLLLHEQVRRKSWGRFFQASLRLGRKTYPPAYGVGLHELEDRLAVRGAILHRHLGGSPLRKLLRKLLDGTSLELLRPLAAWVDSIWCATMGRVLPSVGASEVQIVFRKT
jgi:SAM-dependent methyltransferase